MRLETIRISNFQSFGPEPEIVSLEPVTYLLGPNGAGKTAVLQALGRMFAVDSALRGVRNGDFHRTHDGGISGHTEAPDPCAKLWIETEFAIPEAGADEEASRSTSEFLRQMRTRESDGMMYVAIRLTATLYIETGEIEEQLVFVTERDAAGEPSSTTTVSRLDRRRIHLHYLPARRDATSQVSFAAMSALSRTLRSANWTTVSDSISGWNQEVTSTLGSHPAIQAVEQYLSGHWRSLHRGRYFGTLNLAFGSEDVESLLRQLTVSFSQSPDEKAVDFTRLSDGQQSLLYVSTALALQAIGRDSLSGGPDAHFDSAKLRPPIFTIFAVEEPENSLSPYYLGRVLNLLRDESAKEDCQTIIATHAPDVVRREPPHVVRHLRLNGDRATRVRAITLPPETDEASKYVREAVAAYPELYFARLVVLGEGDSELVFVPRFLSSLPALDATSIAVVPLGGRHVNHFWRLLHDLEIPHVTLLDLDLGRYGAGWGRIKHAVKNLKTYSTDPEVASKLSDTDPDKFASWNTITPEGSESMKEWIDWLESANVFFAAPLDLDLLLMSHYPGAFGAEASEPDDETISQVMRGRPANIARSEYTPVQLSWLQSYSTTFLGGSKPAVHLSAMAELSDYDLHSSRPPVLDRLSKAVVDLMTSHDE